VPIRQDTLRERWLAQQRYADTTQQTYRETLHAFQRRFGVYAERVTEAMLIDFLTTDDGGEPTRRAPGTLARQRATLCSFWRWASKSGFVHANPAVDLGDLNLGTGERRPGRWLTKAEALALLAEADDGTDQGSRDAAIIAVALLTGLRRSELAGLRWRDVNMSERRLQVLGKGSKFGTVGLPPEAAAALSRWLGVATGLRGRKPRPDDPCFPSGHPCGGLHRSARLYLFDWERPLSRWGIRAMVARRADDAGLGVVATHDLRRSFAGFLDEEGTSLQGIQAALRHSSPAVTARCYLDRSPRRAIAATATLTLRT
jgi:integrase/recombinase XerC